LLEKVDCILCMWSTRIILAAITATCPINGQHPGSHARELKPLGNLTFFFHQCPAERGDQNDTIYTKALREHPQRVFDPAIADVQISHLSCFVRVGHQADIRPPANVVARFETGLAVLFYQHDSQRDFEHLPLALRERTHRAMTNCRSPYFRPGLDICLPLPGGSRCRNVDSISMHRRWLASFKGSRKSSVVRSALARLHAPDRGIVVEFTDVTGRGAGFNYCGLMNTSYGLAPAGREPATHRFLEVLSAGCIPVPAYEARDRHVPLPFAGLIDWAPCTQIVTSVEDVASFIDASRRETDQRLVACKAIYETHFADKRRLGDTVLAAVGAVL